MFKTPGTAGGPLHGAEDAPEGRRRGGDGCFCAASFSCSLTRPSGVWVMLVTEAERNEGAAGRRMGATEMRGRETGDTGGSRDNGKAEG